MTDLERFFRRLVRNLAGIDPARLHRPLPLADIRDEIVPYRANRRALALDSSEDYEMVLLRLCAGEDGLVRADPEEARTRFVKELGSPNPDLAVLRAFENVVLSLRSEPLARALGPDSDLETAYAPPRPVVPEPVPQIEFVHPGDIPAEHDDSIEAPEGDEESSPRCPYCGGGLPPHRPANFCPQCGQSQTVPTCSRCRSELEPGWKHCVNCGTAVGEG